MGCILGARFNMWADVLRQGDYNPPGPGEEEGTWTTNQDPITGEILRVWVPGGGTDDPATPGVDESIKSFRCIARGVITAGISGQGTQEVWSAVYENENFVKIQFPASEEITERDRITNIRNDKGVIWKEPQLEGSPPTIFDVIGVTPIVGPFGEHIENHALLTRSETQA